MEINISKDKTPESFPTQESGFSALKYLGVALTISAIGAGILLVNSPAAIALFAVASWYLWSAAIIVINRAATDTCLATPIHRIYAMAMEVNSGIAAAALFPATCFSAYHNPQGDPNGRPILLVNGYLSFGSTWHYLRKELVKAELGPIYTMNIGSGRSIVTYAEQVQEKVAEIQQETGRKDLILIGHSKGGLVSSYYATHLATPETTISDVITIGSPLAGTPLACIGPGYDAQEMRSDSEFHRELRNKIEDFPLIRFSHIASESDEVVPLSSALLGEDSSRQFVLKDMGHLGLVFSSRVADRISTWLKT